jgi:hypothetical protein
MFARRLVQAAVCVQLVLMSAQAARADVPRLPPPIENSLQEVLDHIRSHAATGAWQKEGWRDEKIEAWLDKLVAAIAKGADRPDLALPVRMADLKPADPNAIRASGLVVGTDVKAMGMQNSVVLADGNIDATLPRNCVLVARGVVSISGARNCVIISGACVSGSHDGEPGGTAGGSLIVSRGWIDLETAYGSILVGGLGTTASRSQEALFVNTEIPPARAGFDRHRGSKSVKITGLPLESMPLHPLGEKVKLLGVIQAQPKDDPLSRIRLTAGGVVFRLDDRRYVADLGEAIVDEAGNPVEMLRDWKLAHASDRVAIFRSGDAEFVVRAESK